MVKAGMRARFLLAYTYREWEGLAGCRDAGGSALWDASPGRTAASWALRFRVSTAEGSL